MMQTTTFSCPRCHAATRRSPCDVCGAVFDPDGDTTQANPGDAVGIQTPGGYRADGLLASGGMGLVLHGVHLDSGRPVVLKAPRDRSKEAQERFSREAKALATCDHPNIARLLDVDITPGGRPLLVLEQVEGADLAAILRRGPLPLGLLERVAADLIRALDHLHRRDIVHRDVKPANIVVGPDRAVLLDFGIASIDRSRLIAGRPRELTPAGSILGTPPFCAPEQLLDPRRVGPAADVYAFGMVLRRCLPTTDEHNTHHHERLTDWWRLADACCAEQPDDRPADDALVDFVNRLPALPAPPTSTPIRRWSFRLPQGSTGAITAAMIVGAIGTAGIFATTKPTPQLLNGTVDGSGTVVLQLDPDQAITIEPLNDTRVRLPGGGAWRAERLQLRTDASGRLDLQVIDDDNRWQVILHSNR